MAAEVVTLDPTSLSDLAIAAVVSILRSKPHPQASQTARPSTNLPRPVHSHLGICRLAVAQERQKMDDELTAIDRPGGSVAAFPHRLPTAHIVACTLSRSSSAQILCSFIQSGLVQRQAQLPPETAPSADKYACNTTLEYEATTSHRHAHSSGKVSPKLIST